MLFLAYIGACADWRACPALSKVLEAIGGKEWGWVCSDTPNWYIVDLFLLSSAIE